LQGQLQVALDAETWTICPVPDRAQQFASSLLITDQASPASGKQQSRAHDHKADTKSTEEAAPVTDGAASPPDNGSAVTSRPLQEAIQAALGDGPPAQSAGSATAGSPTAPHQLVLPFGSYFIVNSLAVLLQHIDSLLAFGAVPCQLQFEMGGRIGELLRYFNSRSQQLVLGAGAMSTAGLKSITARHMAVCSQCLLLLEALMPYLRHRVLAGVPPAQVASLSSLLESASEVRLLMPAQLGCRDLQRSEANATAA
jgi:vacuolar protein sorting-associated protein 54